MSLFEQVNDTMEVLYWDKFDVYIPPFAKAVVEFDKLMIVFEDGEYEILREFGNDAWIENDK